MLRAFRFILVDFCSFTNGEVMACLSFKIFFWKLPKLKFLNYFFKIQILKIKFFGQLFSEIKKFFFFLFVWMLKEPISTKKSEFLKILHPLARPLCRDRAGTEQGPSRDRAGTEQGPSRDRAGTEQGPSRDRAGTDCVHHIIIPPSY
jgi:hypothetical protein